MIRVKHAPSAAALGESAYTIGRGEKRRWRAELAQRQQSLNLQAVGMGQQARSRREQLALQKKGMKLQAERSDEQLALQQQELGFRRDKWAAEPSRQLEKSLQAQERLQQNVAYEYSVGQKRERARIIEGLGWIDAEVIAGRLLPEHGEDLAGQMWAKYYGIHPYPIDKEATPQEIYNSNLVTDSITGAQYRMTERGGFDPVGIVFKDYAKLRADAITAFTTQVTDPDSKDFGKEIVDYEAADKFVDETMVRFTKIQGFAARAEEEQRRQAEQGPQPSAEQQASQEAAVEALPTLFKTLIKGQPKIGRKKKGKPSLFTDDVYGEEAYDTMLIEAIGRLEQEEGIPPDVVKAELDKWWDKQYDKDRGKWTQRFGNRMEFKGAGRASETKRIKMKSPNGEIYEIDRSEAEEAKKHGWTMF